MLIIGSSETTVLLAAKWQLVINGVDFILALVHFWLFVINSKVAGIIDTLDSKKLIRSQHCRYYFRMESEGTRLHRARTTRSSRRCRKLPSSTS